MIDGEFSLRVPCGRGLVDWLEDELDELGFTERLPARKALQSPNIGGWEGRYWCVVWSETVV